jgi:arylamine N-acetyltransferase
MSFQPSNNIFHALPFSIVYIVDLHWTSYDHDMSFVPSHNFTKLSCTSFSSLPVKMETHGMDIIKKSLGERHHYQVTDSKFSSIPKRFHFEVKQIITLLRKKLYCKERTLSINSLTLFPQHIRMCCVHSQKAWTIRTLDFLTKERGGEDMEQMEAASQSNVHAFLNSCFLQDCQQGVCVRDKAR